VRNVTASANAPDNRPANPEALKARKDKTVLYCTPILIPRLQRFDRNANR